MPYQPIESYGVVGDMRTAALIGCDGSIDWYCFPKFDSPSVFAAILDDKKGGRFRIGPAKNGIGSKQLYWPQTNVLITRFLDGDGVGEVIDFMPVGPRASREHDHHLIRIVRVVRGRMRFHLDCQPAFNYGRDAHRTRLTSDAAIFETPALTLALVTHVPLTHRENGVTAEFTLDEDGEETFVFRAVKPDCAGGIALNKAEAEQRFGETVGFWRKWLSQCTYKGRWREMVERSALVLKLMTFQPTGAIVAAPTTSLPESIGGGRNWDYRYTWLRDAAFTIYALMRIGFTEEAGAFMHWIEARCAEPNEDGSLQLAYKIEGGHDLHEEELSHLDGYRGSRPVRIGNAASLQLQLDVYGELLDSVYLFNKYGTPISFSLWSDLRRLVNWVCDHWHLKDEGVWETRGPQQHFVFSKLMCWVALDRGLRLADKRSFPADRERWLKVRDEIYEEIMREGWSESREAFVQAYGSERLDASTLLMPLVFFTSPTDPQMLKTLEAIQRSPQKGGLVTHGLVYRYTDEGEDEVFGEEGTFNLCTFWLVEALTRAGRDQPEQLEHARYLFEQMLGYANHLGLYSEQISRRGEALGNFPQAFTHLALISAAFNLDRALDGR